MLPGQLRFPRKDRNGAVVVLDGPSPLRAAWVHQNARRATCKDNHLEVAKSFYSGHYAIHANGGALPQRGQVAGMCSAPVKHWVWGGRTSALWRSSVSTNIRANNLAEGARVVARL